jgi:hypothetical protein
MGATNTSCAGFGSEGVTVGKFYWETSVTSSSFANNCIQGIGNTGSSAADFQYIGVGPDTCGVFGTGTASDFYYNAGLVWASSTFVVVSGDRIGHALDLVNGLYWIEDITLASGWYGSSGSVTGNPATQNNGFVLLSGITANPVVPALSLKNSGDVGNGYFLPALWLGTPPSGFVALSHPVFLDSGVGCDQSLAVRSGNERRRTMWTASFLTDESTGNVLTDESTGNRLTQ